MRQNAVRKLPRHLRDLLLALRIPEQILPALGNRNVRVHAAAVHAHHRLRQKARRHPHLRRNLTADQLIQLNLVRSRNHLAIGVVDLKLDGATSGWSFSFSKPIARCTSAVVSMNSRSGSPGSE